MKDRTLLKKKYVTILLVLLMLVVFVVVLGSSYAFFTSTVKGKEFVIYTGNLKVDYTKKTNVINVENLYPMTNTQGLNTTSHEFTVTNNGNITARYQVRLELDNNLKNQIPVEYIKLSYNVDDGTYSEPILLSNLNSNLVFIKDMILEKTKSNDISIKLWIDINAPNDIEGKEFKAKVVVDSIQNIEDGYVVDTIPIIYLNKNENGNQDINLKVNETYTELGVEKVEDDKDILTVNKVVKTYEYYDGSNLTTVDSIDTSKTGIYYITYSIKDSNNNTGKTVRIVTVNNTNQVPSITLNGDASITLGENDYYKENGVTVENNNQVIILGKVKTSTIGTYIVRYIVIDSNNNLNSVVRTVNVIKAYTEEILNNADPILTSNLTPVKIQDDGTVLKASTASEWYDYETKQWANAVVLKTPTEVIGENNIHGATITNNYASFDGNDDYINLGLENYDFGNNATISIRFSINDFNDESDIIGNWEQSGGGIYVRKNKYLHGDFYLKELGGYVEVQTSKPIEKNKYYTVTLVYDGSEVILYIDGKVEDRATAVGTIEIAEVPIFIGANPQLTVEPGAFSNINVMEYAIYNRALSSDEISNNMHKNINITNSNGLLRFGDFNNGFINNEVIPEDNIESYFVWIPKYSYQLWDLGNYSSLTTIDSTKPHAIPIKFGITNTSDYNTGECTTPGVAGESGNCEVGDYMTHPAFLAFDTNGLWVGKFETGYDGATSTTQAEVNGNDANKVIIKPNVYSWRNINVGNMFENSLKYMDDEESHMMKNTEWGAVAYLSHSIYGSSTSLRVNNNNAYITGYSAIKEPLYSYGNTSVDGLEYEITELGKDGTYTLNYFNQLSNLSSTNRNKSGIYDMSGGSFEYVMGYTIKSETIGGYSEITNLYPDIFTNLSWDKYYDKYTADNYLMYNNRILGDATGEMGPFGTIESLDTSIRNTTSWYNDYGIHFVNKWTPWFHRGSSSYAGISAGNFAFGIDGGNADNRVSFRIVLAPTK